MDNDSSDISSARPGWSRRPSLPAGASRTEIYVSRFREETSWIEASSPLPITQTPVEFLSLPESDSPVPTSPVPSYHSLVLYTGEARQTVVDVGGLSRASTASPSSLPDYDKIESGPPTAYPGYSNYVIPGMEMQADEEEIWIGLEPSYWNTAPFITDPSMPRCPGLLDGSCPIHETHNAGSYFLEQRAPSALLVGVLAHHNVQHVFEGDCPPAAVWAALLRRLNGSENEASENLLFGFRWWHCPEYRARIITRRQRRLDIRQSTVYTRRVNRQHLREWVEHVAAETSQDGDLLLGQIESLENNFSQVENVAPENNADGLWDAYFYGNDEPGPTGFEQDGDIHLSHDNSELSVSDVDSVSLQYSDLVQASRATDEEENYLDTTYFFLPEHLHTATDYHQYGLTPPPEFPMILPPANLPPYPPCLSALCPIQYPHAQGPYWDSGPISTPTSLIPGPMAHLRAAPNLAAYLDALAEHGLGDLFGAETSPPMFILAAVERIVDGSPQLNDLQMVERFRFFHCRACRPIVMPDEEMENHEEDDEEPPFPSSTQSSGESGLDADDTMDSDDWGQYFD